MTTTLKGAYRPTINRFTLGSAEVTTILDGAHIRDAVNPDRKSVV